MPATQTFSVGLLIAIRLRRVQRLLPKSSRLETARTLVLYVLNQSLMTAKSVGFLGTDFLGPAYVLVANRRGALYGRSLHA
jgi:hypothetical protein